ncbi:MAG: DUF924 domain-containing protein [Betaproteobacteria bacterium]|nr:DUF924 domain-containing protein [Betaproteobacteria bacterium]
MPTSAQEVLTFWFGASQTYGQSRPEWFRKDSAFDESLRARFSDVVDAAARGELRTWENTPRGCLALLIVLDQFPRNLFRGDARAFATDAGARRVCRHVLQHGFDRDFLPVERMFVYLPLEHSESLADQDECHRLMLELKPYPETANLHEWADKHRVIIRRFGRFPHRNAALGRESTAEEVDFLKSPGSSF